MNDKFISLICGVIFGIGLVISGMTNPEKVIGFLSITHNWDASLIFVMGGAVITAGPFFFLLKNKETSALGNQINLPKKQKIDKKTIIGASLFGIGCGLVGLCPGPAISALATLDPVAFVFLISMAAGVLAKKNIVK